MSLWVKRAARLEGVRHCVLLSPEGISTCDPCTSVPQYFKGVAFHIFCQEGRTGVFGVEVLLYEVVLYGMVC